MTGRWLVVLNPTAGHGRARRRWPALAAALRAAGIAFDCATTTTRGDATRTVRDADDATVGVLVVGGDGTLNEVLNGALAHRTPPILAVAPYGTGNDWARGIGIPADPGQLAALIARGGLRRVDVGYARDGEQRTHAFLNAAGVGFDAHVLEAMARSPRRVAAYPRAALASLVRYDAPQLSIRADALAIDAPCLMAMVTLGTTAGGGMRFTPTVSPPDGRFGVCIVRRAPHLQTLALLPRLYLGGLEHSPLVASTRAQRVRIEAATPVRMEADGQLLGLTPVDFWVAPKAIQVIAPGGSPASRA